MKLTQRLRSMHPRRPFSTQRDEVLARRVYLAFERDLAMANLQGLHFYTFKGTVTVYGTIRHELDRDLLLSLIRRVPGVKKVVSHLQVLDQPAPE